MDESCLLVIGGNVIAFEGGLIGSLLIIFLRLKESSKLDPLACVTFAPIILSVTDTLTVTPVVLHFGARNAAALFEVGEDLGVCELLVFESTDAPFH